MLVQMKLLSDAVFGDGQSIPGGEDISIKHDQEGFPYYSGSTFRGVLRTHMLNYLIWTGMDEAEITRIMEALFGKADMLYAGQTDKIYVCDFTIPTVVKDCIRQQTVQRDEIFNAFTYLRRFTSINENGTAKEGSLRTARCLIQGLSFYGEIICAANSPEQKVLTETLGYIKWIGSMRNRGFGRVKVCQYEGGVSHDALFRI